MEINQNKVVSLVYELRIDGNDGEVVDKATVDRPLTFIYGRGNLLPKFESNLSDKIVGDKFDFRLDCVDGYGVSTDEAIVDIPLQAFIVEGEIEDILLDIGAVVPMQDNQGRHFNGTVVEVSKETVKMDFNHPLADEDLYFSGEVIEIRNATDEEMEHGHVNFAEDTSCCAGCGDDSLDDMTGGCASCGGH